MSHPSCRSSLFSSLSLPPVPFSPFYSGYPEGIIATVHPSAMRMSCNGCRVLRKGCSDNCTIRPCLQWIKSSEAQANATVFLAKFYGRAGLMNLINAGPDHLRPAIFRSLLYEACGRMVNPIYGSVGLLWSGNWPLCQTAVENVLRGAPITQISSDSATAAVPSTKAYDIRHVVKNSDVAAELHKVAKPRPRFKRSGHVIKPKAMPGFIAAEPGGGYDPAVVCPGGSCPVEPANRGQSRENGSVFSVESVEWSHVSQAEPNDSGAEAEVVELDLTLGLRTAALPAEEGRVEVGARGDDACPVELGLGLIA
ncbi:LOB domain-containing protein 41 [Cocos nucifera]|uniref:LOB domain-containing protein 41 n=1 Tax=Cocos nucifera TaxID=13894 RepID=A0A8K0MWQ4_COCNU|nr:LOB domain-containing protein 41 [Cocos nucifera]